MSHLELSDLLQQAMLKKTSEEWLAAFRAIGVPTGPVNRLPDILDDNPHVKAREMVVGLDHPTLGPMKALGLAVKLSETPGAVTRPTPTLGQHTAQILTELGYTPEHIEALRADRVIHTTGDEHGTYVGAAPAAGPVAAGSSAAS